MEYEIVIGLEVHAELSTKSKIFCSCTTEFGGEPNTHCCPICTGMPGVLPVLNEKVVEYDFNILDEIEPSFAITIHKSQGSEFPVVIIPMYPGPQILMTRNLLYTAVTRARNLVILVGSEITLNEMINNQKEALRYSELKEKLKKGFLGLSSIV